MKVKFNWKFNKKVLWVWALFLFVLLLECAMKWIYGQFKRINLDEIALVLQVGMGGVDDNLLWSFFKRVILRAMGWSIVLAAVYNVFYNYKIVRYTLFAVVFGILCGRFINTNVQFGSFLYHTKSDFYEREYVHPNSVKISFPRKRNVLMIALESIEKSYADKKMFGKKGLTPHITKLEDNHISFEQYEQLAGLTHTIAAITGMTTGLPMFYTNYKNIEKMVGAHGIGKIFTANGYKTYSFFPASGRFSLKENFLRRMGFDTVYDGERLLSMLDYELDVKPFDGIDDGTLFKMTKPMIKEIIQKQEPYFILMETINVHSEGYFTQVCRDMGFKQENLIDIIKCEDKLITDFVKWFRKQDPTAVVILINDHIAHMCIDGLEQLEEVEERPLANAFINTNAFYGVDIHRPVAAFDFFPTIIEAAGGKIAGCRLGLGTSLTAQCKGVKTLRERYDDQELEKLMQQKNDLYYKLATGKDKE